MNLTIRLLKGSLDGTHHNVSERHLQRYASEFESHWNASKMTDGKRMQALINGGAGMRLSHTPLTQG